MTRVHYAKPSVTDLEMQYVADAVANGWGERCYDYIRRFESDFASYLGVEHAIATSSCTGALHIGLSALGLGPGDEIIIGDINWIGSIAPAVQLGAKPVFVDVRRDTWCIDPAKVEVAITPRTKAVIAVHLYGNPCDMDALLSLGRKHGIHIIEDAAQAIGARWKGRRAGSMGTFGAFSFHGTKSLSTGEGGMFVTRDPALYERALTLSNQGRSRKEARQFWPEITGFKYKLSNLQAAMGCAQLERVEELVARKAQIFRYYRQALQGLPLRMNPSLPDAVNSYWMPTIVVDEDVSFDRDALLAAFRDDHIDGRVFFWPLSMLPMFEDAAENTVSYSLYRRAVNLPSYHDISDAEMDRVIRILRGFVQRSRVHRGMERHEESVG